VVPLLLRDEFAVVDAEHHPWSDSDDPSEAAAKALKGISTLHVLGSLPVWAYDILRSAGPSRIEIDYEALPGLREFKDEREAEALRRSGQVTDEIMTWVATLDLEGLTERALSGRVRARYLEQGHAGEDCLVASGANAAMPHYMGGDVPIDRGVPLLLDFGGVVDHYVSDMTRVLFPGTTDPRIDEVYEIVCDAYDAALAKVEPGVPCQEVDRAARRVIEDGGYGEQFVHRTGHGIGLDVHEPPYLREGNEGTLEVGHVFSIEPGIYLPGQFGLRYENIVYLGPDGPEELNRTPRRHRL
ncbi:MAG: M24 family metallopeptidase, partial [Actinomycetota bacterium]